MVLQNKTRGSSSPATVLHHRQGEAQRWHPRQLAIADDRASMRYCKEPDTTVAELFASVPNINNGKRKRVLACEARSQMLQLQPCGRLHGSCKVFRITVKSSLR